MPRAAANASPARRARSVRGSRRPVLLLLSAAALALALGPAARATRTAPAVLNYGDSLAVGTGPFLASRLRGWNVSQLAATSLHASDGPLALQARGAALPRVVVVSLGTNDDPGAVSSFAAVVREVVRIAGPTRCVIWSTIVRPPYRGVSYDGYNSTLRRLAGRLPGLRVFDWQALARAHPQWFGPDGVHPSAEGYGARAAALAVLARRCG